MGPEMTFEWTDWKDRDDTDWISPYADWNKVTGGLHPLIRQDALLENSPDDSRRLVYPQFTEGFEPFRDSLRTETKSARDAVNASEAFLRELLRVALNQIYKRKTTLPPLPLNTVTGCNKRVCDGGDLTVDLECHFKHLEDHGPRPDALKKGHRLPPEFDLPEDSVVVGLIDVGLPLGHRSTRMADGTTRVLAAWQQTAARRHLNPDEEVGKKQGEQMYLPFGQEMLAPDINQALRDHTAGHLLSGQLDEAAFNRACHLEDFENLFGQKELARRAAHGAHVLDCAAGMDAGIDADLAARTRIIAVNLPERALVGHSAQFLEFFAIHGILRTVMLSDAVWLGNHPPKPPRGAGADTGKPSDPTDMGYPVVINLSFGKQADSRDGYDLIASVMRELNTFRESAGFRPVLLSMPAGNENLERGNIRTRIMAGAVLEFDWRLLPEDQSASFVEIWSDATEIAKGGPVPIAVEVISPLGDSSGLKRAGNQQYRDYRVGDQPVLGLYSRLRPEKTTLGGKARSSRLRARYVIAAKQTQLYEPGPLAPAGLWKIRLKNMAAEPLTVDISVQTDQNERAESLTNRRSYFEVADYERFDETGRVIDSYSYPLDGTDPEITDVSNVLRRHGTINAIGLERVTAIAAGHRGSDGRMEPYSGTGIHKKSDEVSKKPDPRDPMRLRLSEPTASLPVRDGAAHFGTLGSGSRDGSVVAMQGTSFGAAKITRRLVDILHQGERVDLPQAIRDLVEQAAEEEKTSAYPGQVTRLKAGAGRMKAHVQDDDAARHNRFGRR